MIARGPDLRAAKPGTEVGHGGPDHRRIDPFDAMPGFGRAQRPDDTDILWGPKGEFPADDGARIAVGLEQFTHAIGSAPVEEVEELGFGHRPFEVEEVSPRTNPASGGAQALGLEVFMEERLGGFFGLGELDFGDFESAIRIHSAFMLSFIMFNPRS